MLPGTVADAFVEPGRVPRLLAGFPALRHRNFRLFVVGQGSSLVGYWMQSVAQGWLVYRLEGRPLDLAKVAFAGYLPILCLAPFAGVVADRLPRRPVLLVTQSLLGLLALVLGVLVWSGAVTVPLVVLFAGGVGLVSALDVPTRQSFLVEMASPEDLPNAIALNSSIFNGARLVGPALAGALVAALGEAPCFLLNAASYVAVLAAPARPPPRPSCRRAAPPARSTAATSSSASSPSRSPCSASGRAAGSGPRSSARRSRATAWCATSPPRTRSSSWWSRTATAGG